mmetsp:Transcript_23511/g.58397  ORF Transcript_23511/g.58397 Transcript_23511/m.58397 type:complete len:142 (-) Transcript_23511:49-474(-)
MSSLNSYKEDFCSLIANMKRLKSLDLSIFCALSSWNELLRTISTLEGLENLKLCWDSTFSEPAEDGLLYIANGPVRFSLIDCEIVTHLDQISVPLRETLTRCFRDVVEPSFEKRDGGSRKLTIYDGDEYVFSQMNSFACLW